MLQEPTDYFEHNGNEITVAAKGGKELLNDKMHRVVRPRQSPWSEIRGTNLIVVSVGIGESNDVQSALSYSVHGDRQGRSPIFPRSLLLAWGH